MALLEPSALQPASARFAELSPEVLGATGESLFVLSRLLDREPTVRRALSDPNLPVEVKQALATDLVRTVQRHSADATPGGRIAGLVSSIPGIGRLVTSTSDEGTAVAVALVADLHQRQGTLPDLVGTAGILALLAQAEAQGQLGDVEDELFRFGRLVDREPQLREALADPVLPTENKVELVDALLRGKVNDVTWRLVVFQVERGRGRRLADDLSELAELAAERTGHVLAIVRTAVPLDDERRRRLAEALNRTTGKQVTVEAVVDPSILGGVVVRIGDEVIDGSVVRRLELARQGLSRA